MYPSTLFARLKPTQMKHLISIFVILFVAFSAASAQNTGILKNKKITSDEVPAVVGAAFKKDFPNATEGTWTIFYNQHLNGNSVMVTPRWYLFTVKGDHKAMVQYSPAGKIEKSKGMGKDEGEEVAGAGSSSNKGSN